MGSTLTPPFPPVTGGALPDPILVVDDDAFVCTVVAAALSAAGARVTCCTSGQEALAIVTDLKPALVLLDFVMPGLDGRATWSALRERLTAAGVALPRGVFLTARAGEETKHLGAEPHIAGVIAKPFDPMTFVDQLRGVLQAPAGDAGALRLAAVTEEFARSLVGAAEHIRALAGELRAGGWRRAGAEALLARAHALAGSAGLFKRHALGAAAGEAEGLLLNYLKLDRAPDVTELRRLDAAVTALLSHCR